MQTAIREKNGTTAGQLQRAEEADQLLAQIKDQIISLISQADEDFETQASTGHGSHPQEHGGPRTALLEHHPPNKLAKLMDVRLPPPSTQGTKDTAAFQSLVDDLLKYSVNTWHQGFLSKLYSTPHPISLAADLLLSALNTNVHVYQVSPALTVIEKETSRALASLFGLTSHWSGGVSMPGGSAANHSALIIARNTLFPETKTHGISPSTTGGGKLVVFTSKHGHYSLEKACQMAGLGSSSVRTVPVDAHGRMDPTALQTAITTSRNANETPFFVNATSGTTVLGSFDPLWSIADICHKESLWFHVDASWGGGVVFSDKHRTKVQGAERADSITLCPHKMLNIPVTCSFLLGADLRKFHHAMTLPAGYLFHDDEENGKKKTDKSGVVTNGDEGEITVAEDKKNDKEVWDLADLTPQCGRRGDALKLALTWTYLGTKGIAGYVDHAFDIAAYMAEQVDERAGFSLVSEQPPPCLQVCFYYDEQNDAERNSRVTAEIAKALVPKGFMTDYAPGERGQFFRVVVNSYTRKETVDGLLDAIDELGKKMKI